MKTAIRYYSKLGNTRTIAEAIAEGAGVKAVSIASHLDSVNHATVSSDDVKRMAAEKGLTEIRVPADGEVVSIDMLHTV